MGKIFRYAMDGKDVGFRVKYKGDFIRTKQGRIRLFTNLEFAKTIAYIKGAQSGRDYEIELNFFGSHIRYDSLQRVQGNFEFYAVEEGSDTLNRYIIEQTYIKEYSHFGYVVFDNGNNVLTQNKEQGSKRRKALFKVLLAAIEKVSERNNIPVKDIMEYNADGDTEVAGITVSFRDTTAQLSIFTNDELCYINKWRKELRNEDGVDMEYSKCFPFIKNMDNYTTFYTLCSKELYEPVKADRSKAKTPHWFREELVKELTENWDYYNNSKSKRSGVAPQYLSVIYNHKTKILSR